jgi:23S rRNA (guanosine2251-2'-O)-methyltransferase
MKYSQKKFSQFITSKQEKIISEFIISIQNSWHNKEERELLLTELKNCLNWSQKDTMQEISQNLKGVKDLEEFLSIMIPWEQQHHRELRDHDFLILNKDGKKESSEKLDLTVILHDLRSAFNVGSIIRTAECLGINKLIFSGYSPTPENLKVQKTSMGTHNVLQWEQTDDIRKVIRSFQEAGTMVYGLETTTNAQNIFKTDINSPAVLILGNEALGISRSILELCDKVIEIPTGGWKNSLNVGVAFAVAGYEILRKWRYRS